MRLILGLAFASAALLTAAVDEEGTGSAWFRFAPNNKLLVRALYYTGNQKLVDCGRTSALTKSVSLSCGVIAHQIDVYSPALVVTSGQRYDI
jgi:hypothetical protein